MINSKQFLEGFEEGWTKATEEYSANPWRLMTTERLKDIYIWFGKEGLIYREIVAELIKRGEKLGEF